MEEDYPRRPPQPPFHLNQTQLFQLLECIRFRSNREPFRPPVFGQTVPTPKMLRQYGSILGHEVLEAGDLQVPIMPEAHAIPGHRRSERS